MTNKKPQIKEKKVLPPIEPPCPIYAVYIENGTDSVFYGMIDKEDAEQKIKNPVKLLKETGKELSGDLKAVIKVFMP